VNPDSETVERIAKLAVKADVTVATAESLTSGVVATRLGEGPDAAQWFRGGVVAYHESVKFDVLGVEEGPVVTKECAEQMARGTAKLLGADVVVSATGVGGPDPSEGKPAGTVIVGLFDRGDVLVRELSLDGDPDEVLHKTASKCIALVEEVLGRASSSD
jgi:nicotinamide-nucleotide amidase